MNRQRQYSLLSLVTTRCHFLQRCNPWLLVLLFAYGILPAQQDKKVITIHSEENQVIDATTDPATQYLNGNVKIFHEGTFMYCDTAVLRGSQLRMYFNVVMMQHDTIRIFADSIYYNGDSLVAYVYGNIVMENGPSRKMYTSFLRYDAKNKIAIYPYDARLEDGPSSLVSRSGRYHLNERTAWFYKQVQVTGDDFTLVTDSLAYQTSTQKAVFLAPVRIDRDTSAIYAETGWFDLDDKKGDFIKNAAFREGTTTARADTIQYDGEKDIIILRSDSTLSSYFTSQDTAMAKYIFFDRKKEEYILEGTASYVAPENEVRGEKVSYIKKTGEMHVSGRSMVSDPPFLIEADTLDYNKTSQYGKADGKVIWRDTAARSAIIADHVLYKGDTKDMKAHNDIDRPLFVTEMDADTLFLKADTLRSYRKLQAAQAKPPARRGVEKNKDFPGQLQIEAPGTDSLFHAIEPTVINSADSLPAPPPTDTLDFFAGEGNVRIYKSDMQAVCDTFLFHQRDSLFLLRGKPVVWSDSTQITGDTIQMAMKNQKIDRMIITSEANVVSTEDALFFDQITGKWIEASFFEGKLARMYVNGNAQLVYYLRDKEKAYIGVNTTEASSMLFLLEDNKVQEIRNFNQPQSKVLPMEKTDHDAIKVKGFQWAPERRPLSRAGL